MRINKKSNREIIIRAGKAKIRITESDTELLVCQYDFVHKWMLVRRVKK